MNRLERLLADLFQQKVAEVGVSPAAPPEGIVRRIRRRQAVALMTAVAVLGAVTVGSVAGAQALLRQAKPAVHPSPAPVSPHRGGSIVVATREFPECLNPITACAAATGTWWTVLEHVMPRAMELDAQGNFVPSPLLVNGPLPREQGGDPLAITYVIDPAARWADGTPITSADFDFTWRAIMHTTGAYSTAGYDRIASIDTRSPRTVVVKLKAPYADWADLFGGSYGGLLEKAAFPTYANDPAPDLSNEMQTDIPFSGGPWMLKSFSQGKIVLVRNDRYFGKPALMDQVTILPLTGPTAPTSLLKDGTIDAFPWPAEEGFLDQFAGDAKFRALAADGFGFEALWFNHNAPPLDDPRVREALMYSIDRQAVIEQVVSRIDPRAQVLSCGFVAVPGLGPWCQTAPFAPFTYDPAKAKQILESDGYDCSHTPCTKGGKPLTIDYSTVSTNERRARIQQLLKERALPAGFELRIKNYDTGTLFGEIAPRGGFGLAQYGSEGAPNPSITDSLSCQSIPTKRNGYTGGNWIRWCDRRASDLMHRSDIETSPERRLNLMDEIYAFEAKDFLSLPLYVQPEMAAWRTDRIGGPIGRFAGSPYGLFFNLNEWYKVSR